MPYEGSRQIICETAIKKALAYSAVFKYPLSFHQLATYLISNQEFDYHFFTAVLKSMIKNKKVGLQKGKCFLPTVRPFSWATRVRNSRDLLKETRLVFGLLSCIPWIKLLCVTGSVAAYNAEKRDDIDVMVVATKGRVWITRFFVVSFLKAVGKYWSRRSPVGKICPNIFIDEDSLAWDGDKKNLYVAHEIAMMQPVIDRDGTYFRFMSKNPWVFGYLSGFKVDCGGKEKRPHRKVSGFVNSLENVFMAMQLVYMKGKKTTEVTTKGVIHFNVNDSTKKVLSEYEKLASGRVRARIGAKKRKGRA